MFGAPDEIYRFGTEIALLLMEAPMQLLRDNNENMEDPKMTISTHDFAEQRRNLAHDFHRPVYHFIGPSS